MIHFLYRDHNKAPSRLDSVVVMKGFVRLILCFLLCALTVTGNNGHEPLKSPRNTLMTLLYQNGCTNRLLAHYIIQASYGGITAAVLNRKIRGLTRYDSSRVSGWFVHLYFCYSVSYSFRIALITNYRTSTGIII